ncbi:LapA family protein [Mycolicibacterium sp. P9-64]|uniref:protein UsfY n=1 Tax=Mycolicibacterium sp. P9-64 TaxID=2024612 RepID=UPI0011EC8122|nr:protein UsfY [Mycolicibacterium sp. P9-64]KAA0079088.1 LapA family protein [Mycolicibacterium sp. P9-64]
MKGAYHDPVDHSRTTQPHAGESMIDTLWFPGLVLIAVGIIGLAGIVAAAAYGHTEWVLPLALVSGAVVTAGGGLIFLEHRRVNRIEQQWRAEHPRPDSHRHAV